MIDSFILYGNGFLGQIILSSTTEAGRWLLCLRAILIDVCLTSTTNRKAQIIFSFR